MKAIAVFPGQPNSVHLAELPTPSVDQLPTGRGVLVRVLRVGVDGTDKESNAAEYGTAPAGDDFLVLGHESFGQVEAVGPKVTEFRPGDYVVATVRRPGMSVYDRIGTSDMTTNDVYYERGINLLHGFLTEYVVDEPEYLVKIPPGLKDVGVLLEPTTVVEKGIAQAYEIQRRLKVWRPRRAAVMGAGTVGLLATLVLRLRGLEVTTFGLTRKPYLNSHLLEAIGARYESTLDVDVLEGATYDPALRRHHYRHGRRRRHPGLPPGALGQADSVTRTRGTTCPGKKTTGIRVRSTSRPHTTPIGPRPHLRTRPADLGARLVLPSPRRRQSVRR
jgi:D-arabinose 1-dehydrogenase-like Zn-dependent alcohol dehydrogenase